MRESIVVDRIRQFSNALTLVRIGEQIVKEYGKKGTCIEGIRDGKPDRIVMDEQVVRAMKGGAFGIWTELVEEGLKDEANQILAEHKASKSEVILFERK